MIDSTGRFSSPLTGNVRTVSRPGDRWAFRRDYESLSGLERARLESFIALQRGAANRALIGPCDYKQRGTWASGELVANYNFAAGATGWTQEANTTLTVADSVARVLNTTTSAGWIQSSALTLTNGAAYVVRVVAFPGNQGSWGYGVTSTLNSGTNDVVNVVPSAVDAINIVGFIATGTTAYLNLFGHAGAANDFIHFTFASVTRCPLVNGANQTGSALIVDKLPTSTDGLLLPGDWIAVGSELKRVTMPVHSDGSGNGIIQFSPPLRAAPSDNSPVGVANPVGRFILAGNEAGWETVPGRFATVSLDFIEAI